MNLFGNGLVYHTPPFAENTEVTGQLKFVAWISMDVPDTDFEVVVYEMTANGTSILLTADMMRARYRDSLTESKLMVPGEVARCEFNGFDFFSRRIAKGSRLRLVLRSPNSMFIQKNYNAGGDVSSESGKDARVAYVTVHHGGGQASFLEIPVAQ